MKKAIAGILIAYFLYTLTLSGAAPHIRVLFSPQDNCAQEIISEIDKAKKSVNVAMYIFTSRPIAQALVRAKERKVNVQVLIDESDSPSYERYSKRQYLANKGVNVKTLVSSAIMHHKFCVIDNRITLTGAYNWTVRADLDNDENLLIINSKETADKYISEFNQLWNGTKIDTYKYKDKSRLEKVPLEGSVSVVVPVKSGGPKESEGVYIGHNKSKKFHSSSCTWGRKISKQNKVVFKSRGEAVQKGYIPCKVCKP